MIIITKDMIEKARARDHGAYNNMSFMDGHGNIIGFLGEYMVAEQCPHLIHVDKFTHDFEFNGNTIEVKTKAQNIPTKPKGTFEASVTRKSIDHQIPDYYIFCRIYKMKHGWIMGAIASIDFLNIGRWLEKGTRDGDNGYIVKESCINIRYNQLKPIRSRENGNG